MTSSRPIELAIVGGGPHGVHLAVAALRAHALARDQLVIIDPRDRLLGRWLDLTRRFTMRHLRSPGVHHLDVPPYALREYSVRIGVPLTEHAPPYALPPLDVFNAHAQAVIDELGLTQRHLRARAVRVEPSPFGWRVCTPDGVVDARNVALCLGDERRHRPAWTSALGESATHVFAPGGHGVSDDARRVVVVGGGMTGAQAALHFAARHDEVALLTRAPFEIRQFDADSAWMGPRELSAFDALTSVRARRRAIDGARFPGSIPHELERELSETIARGALTHVLSEVTDADDTGLTLASGERLRADHVLLATGFGRGRPGGALVDDLIDRLPLPVAPCGFPIPDLDLRWAPGLYLSGGLAELVVGPTARNLLGARDAAQRILDGLVLDDPFPNRSLATYPGPGEEPWPTPTRSPRSFRTT